MSRDPMELKAASDAGLVSPWDLFIWLVTAFVLLNFVAAVRNDQVAWAIILGLSTIGCLAIARSWYRMENR